MRAATPDPAPSTAAVAVTIAWALRALQVRAARASVPWSSHPRRRPRGCGVPVAVATVNANIEAFAADAANRRGERLLDRPRDAGRGRQGATLVDRERAGSEVPGDGLWQRADGARLVPHLARRGCARRRRHGRLLVDGGRLGYVGTDRQVRHGWLRRSAGPSGLDRHAPEPAVGLALDDTRVYWTDPGSGQVLGLTK